VNSIDKFCTPSKAIDTLVLRTVDQLMPELRSRSIQLDLDLDHVAIDDLSEDIILAVRSLIINAIQWAGPRSELAITLIDSPGIDSPGQWELEVCDVASGELPVGDLLNDNHVLDSERMGHHTHENPSIAAAVRAAARCSGTIEAWHCPQGGIAMILVMPRPAQTKTKAA
jgi:hypothetical protein